MSSSSPWTALRSLYWTSLILGLAPFYWPSRISRLEIRKSKFLSLYCVFSIFLYLFGTYKQSHYCKTTEGNLPSLLWLPSTIHSAVSTAVLVLAPIALILSFKPTQSFFEMLSSLDELSSTNDHDSIILQRVVAGQILSIFADTLINTCLEIHEPQCSNYPLWLQFLRGLNHIKLLMIPTQFSSVAGVLYLYLRRANAVLQMGEGGKRVTTEPRSETEWFLEPFQESQEGLDPTIETPGFSLQFENRGADIPTHNGPNDVHWLRYFEAPKPRFKPVQPSIRLPVSMRGGISRQRNLTAMFGTRKTVLVEKDEVTKRPETPSEDPVEEIRLAARVQEKLVTIASDLDSNFGISLLLFTACVFLSLSTGLYVILSCYIGVRCDDAILRAKYALWCFSEAAILAAVTAAAAFCVQESRRTAVILHDNLKDCKIADVKEEIEVLLLQLKHCSLEYSAFGFFPVDFTLLFSIVGSVTTYLVILLQFQMTFNSGDTNEEAVTSSQSIVTPSQINHTSA